MQFTHGALNFSSRGYTYALITQRIYHGLESIRHAHRRIWIDDKHSHRRRLRLARYVSHRGSLLVGTLWDYVCYCGRYFQYEGEMPDRKILLSKWLIDTTDSRGDVFKLWRPSAESGGVFLDNSFSRNISFIVGETHSIPKEY